MNKFPSEFDVSNRYDSYKCLTWSGGKVYGSVWWKGLRISGKVLNGRVDRVEQEGYIHYYISIKLWKTLIFSHRFKAYRLISNHHCARGLDLGVRH